VEKSQKNLDKVFGIFLKRSRHKKPTLYKRPEHSEKSRKAESH